MSLEITTPAHRRLIYSAISDLTKLRRLGLRMESSWDEAEFTGLGLFYSCLPAIEHLHLGMSVNSKGGYERTPKDASKVLSDIIAFAASTNRDNYMSDSEEAEGAEDTALRRRQEPLLKLKELSLWNIINGVALDEILPIFDHTPYLEKLHLPSMYSTLNTTRFADYVTSLCPKIHTSDYYTLGDR